MAVQHQNLAAGRWYSMTLAEQLGNIGSEVGRAINWKLKGHDEYFQKAFCRMLELIDLTLADKKLTFPQRKEIARVREALCDGFTQGNNYNIPLSSWESYFMPFAYLARRNK